MWANLDVLVRRTTGRAGAMTWKRSWAAMAVAVLGMVAVCTARPDAPHGTISGVKAMDVRTGQRFTITLDRDFGGWPVRSPFSGEPTGYPATVCHSRSCAAIGGTWVVRKPDMGLPGVTRCPSCRAIVPPRVH